MTRPRHALLLALAGPAAAAAGMALHALFGEWIVLALYEQRMPVGLLNEIITGQSIHPVEYHLRRADGLVLRVALLLLASGPATGGWVWLARRLPAPWSRPLAGGLLLSTGFVCGVYVLGAPVFETLPGWFWPLHTTALPWVWLGAPLAAGTAAAAAVVLRAPGRRRRNVVLIVLWGACLHHGLALMEGRGLDVLRSRFIDSGHGVFARAAVEQPSLWRVLTRYDELLDDGELSPFFHATKPPGLQVFLGVVERLGRAVPGLPDDPLQRLATFAALILPLLAYAAVIPLYALALRFTDDRGALAAALLYVTAPSVALIGMHADHYLHPLLGTAFLYLAVRALQEGGRGSSLLTGIALLPGHLGLLRPGAPGRGASGPGLGDGPVGPGPPGAGPPRRPGRRRGSPRPGRQWRCCAATTPGPASRWPWRSHEIAKAVDWSLGNRLYYGALNLLEFALWSGPALVLLCVAGLRREVGAPGAALLSLLAGMAIFGSTAGESARLWIFALPLAVLCAAIHIGRRPGEGGPPPRPGAGHAGDPRPGAEEMPGLPLIPGRAEGRHGGRWLQPQPGSSPGAGRAATYSRISSRTRR